MALHYECLKIWRSQEPKTFAQYLKPIKLKSIEMFPFAINEVAHLTERTKSKSVHKHCYYIKYGHISYFLSYTFYVSQKDIDRRYN